MRVLVVDDEKLIRDVIKEYLLLENMEVDDASNGNEAIEKVKSKDFDIIIMDIMMPKMDGYTACREIKKLKDGAMEIKFFDRLKALERLEQSNLDVKNDVNPFYYALEQGLKSLKSEERQDW